MLKKFILPVLCIALCIISSSKIAYANEKVVQSRITEDTMITNENIYDVLQYLGIDFELYIPNDDSDAEEVNMTVSEFRTYYDATKQSLSNMKIQEVYEHNQDNKNIIAPQDKNAILRVNTPLKPSYYTKTFSEGLVNADAWSSSITISAQYHTEWAIDPNKVGGFGYYYPQWTEVYGATVGVSTNQTLISYSVSNQNLNTSITGNNATDYKSAIHVNGTYRVTGYIGIGPGKVEAGYNDCSTDSYFFLSNYYTIN